jgi:hypothetical protein
MGAQEHFTHGILGRLRVAEHSLTNATYVSVVLAKQRRKRLAIAGARTLDDRPGRLVIHRDAVPPVSLPQSIQMISLAGSLPFNTSGRRENCAGDSSAPARCYALELEAPFLELSHVEERRLAAQDLARRSRRSQARGR